MTASNLAAVAQGLLDFCVAALGMRAPERAYIQAGQIALDGCEQIVVALAPSGISMVDLFPGRANSVAKAAQVSAADFQVMVTRCVPSIDNGPLQGDILPDPAAIQAAAEEVMADTETLYCAIAEAAHDGTLFGPCTLSSVGSAIPYGPSGGIGGVTITVTVQTGCPPPAS